MNPYQNPYTYGNPYSNPYAPSRPQASQYDDPDHTPPEKVPVETSQHTYCSICKKKIWTQVRKTRGGVERNSMTDAMFKAICIMFVDFDKNIEHSCPHCGQRFKIYRKIPHRSKIGNNGMVNTQPPHYSSQPPQYLSTAQYAYPQEMLASQHMPYHREIEGSLGAAELEKSQAAVELENNIRDEQNAQRLPFPRDAQVERDQSFTVTRPLQLHVGPGIRSVPCAAVPNARQ